MRFFTSATNSNDYLKKPFIVIDDIHCNVETIKLLDDFGYKPISNARFRKDIIVRIIMKQNIHTSNNGYVFGDGNYTFKYNENHYKLNVPYYFGINNKQLEKYIDSFFI